jgi:regulator of cell morphogenesis and NO signaling
VALASVTLNVPWRALYVGARKLTDDLMEHIHIENNVLFPRFRS